MAGNQLGSCSPKLIKVGLCLIALFIAGYIVGPPLYWHFMEGLTAVGRSSSSCPPCVCDCSQTGVSIAEGLGNISLGDCVKHNPESAEYEQNSVELLLEELNLREADAAENERRADMALLEAKKISSQYQKEADKCNSGMETCEEAREKAEEALAAQKRMTALWEMRAREKGWTEGNTKPQFRAEGNLQTA